MSEIKFTEEELKTLSDLSKAYQDIQVLIGQVSVQKLINNQRAEKIEENELQLQSDYATNQEKEREFVQTLNEKYGPGQLNPATGIFVPTPKEDTQEISSEVK
jgi:hypothetical protein|tara:strand:- start:1157 stop:1465 length:309 start_codon:yes stop_codon:yes gene_type:complete